MNWQGTGTVDDPQYVPQDVHAHRTGNHQLIIRGREANVQLSSITIMQVPPAPSNLRILVN